MVLRTKHFTKKSLRKLRSFFVRAICFADQYRNVVVNILTEESDQGYPNLG